MPIRSAAAGFMALVLLMPLTSTAEKKAAQILRIGDRPAQRLEVRPTLATADTCQVRHDSGAVWAINGWVIGNELYKEYLDPGASCTGPYPFTVTEVAMQMYFTGASPLLVSVDVEGVDNSVPNCPFPGNLLAISSEYQLQVPGAGLYEIWVPLDTPQVVTGPFFAGFFIGNTLDPAAGGAVVTDSFPILCTSYNIWDTSLGYVDLCDNTIYNFPGRLVLFASGIPGGSGGYQPPPALDVTGPDDNDTLYASVDLWAWDTSGSNIIDYVSFEYSTGGGYSEFGRDYDGLRPLRDGVDAAGVGDGFSLNWDFSARTQGFYKVRATAYDTLGRKSSDSINVYLEPTPPIARVTSPADGSDFCSPLTLLMTTSDENLTLVEVYRRNGTTEYSSGLVTLDQSRLGDVNHNPLDGNHASNGEFGDYYCGPVAGTLAIRLWFDRGYNQLMRAGFDTIPMDTVAERLAVLCKTRQNRGTYDENLLKGIKSWVGSHGGMILFDYARRPDYFLLRQWVEEEQRAVILGLGGNPGVFLTVDGFSGWRQPDGSYFVRVSDPLTGSLATLSMRSSVGLSEVYFNGSWHPADLMISLLGRDWIASRSLTGADFNGADGWSFSWAPTGLTEDNPYFFRSIGRDATSLRGSDVVLLRYSCSQNFTAGDYTNDGLADIDDLMYLIAFVAFDGPAPAGSAGRGDANCDQTVNIADVVYYMNFLFGNVAPPCY